MKETKKDPVLKAINDALDMTLREFAEDENLPFDDEAERRSYLYDNGFFDAETWERKTTCMIKDCKNSSVRSHTIQKSVSIAHIADDNHVLRPGFNYRTERYELMPTGINEASTFPGFCEVHEQLFKSFEEAKDFTDDNEIRLQLYRTVCREIAANRKALKGCRYRLDQYLRFRNEKFYDSLDRKIKLLHLDNVQIGSIGYKHHSLIFDVLNSRISTIEEYLKETLMNLHDRLWNDITKNKAQKIHICGIGTDLQIPLCLAGCAAFRIGHKKNGMMIVNILPFADKTLFIVAAELKYKKQLRQYIELAGSSPFSVLATAENWMLHNSDHWFIRPGVWESLPEKLRDNVLTEIADIDHNRPTRELMVFTELRKQLLEQFQKDMSGESPDFIRIVNAEKIKLADFLNSYGELNREDQGQ